MEIRIFITPDESILERFVNNETESLILIPNGRDSSLSSKVESKVIMFDSESLGNLLKEKIEEYNPLGRKLIAYLNLAGLEKPLDILKASGRHHVYDKIYLFNTHSKVFPFQEYLFLKQVDYNLEKVESFNEKFLYTFARNVSLSDRIAYLSESLKKEKELRKLYELKLEVGAIGNALEPTTEPLDVSSFSNHLDVANFLTYGVLPPSFDGWAIDEDLALLLINRIVFGDFTHFIELGSGSSTRLIARALEKIEHSNKLLSIEHSDNYFKKTRNLVQSSDLDKQVSFNLCELVPYDLGNEKYSYYDCEEILDEYLTSNENQQDIGKTIFCLVDGPPGLTNNHARYPILPLLLEHLSSNFCIHLYLDDFHRTQEKEIVSKWSELVKSKGYEFAIEEIENKKGLCIFKVSDSKL